MPVRLRPCPLQRPQCTRATLPSAHSCGGVRVIVTSGSTGSRVSRLQPNTSLSILTLSQTVTSASQTMRGSARAKARTKLVSTALSRPDWRRGRRLERKKDKPTSSTQHSPSLLPLPSPFNNTFLCKEGGVFAVCEEASSDQERTVSPRQ
jgi:hypothetical protein